MRKRLCGILVLAVVVQAIFAVAFIHHSDHSENEVISFEHVQSVSGDSDSDYLANSKLSPLEDFASHHCCHYIAVLTFLGGDFLTSHFSNDKILFYAFNLVSASLSRHLRPPIL